MNIVYGGSFNPPTLAHYTIIEKLNAYFKPDNFIIMPVGNYYTWKTDLVEANKRIEMLEIATSGLGVIISDLEAKQKKYLGTYYILEELSKTYDDLYFVMGADNLTDITEWLNFEKLISKYKFIIITRDNIKICDYIKEKLTLYTDNFLIFEIKIDINASMIRKDLQKNKMLLDEKVYEYIMKNELYEGR